MKRIRYTVDASFANTPLVTALYLVRDPATGEEKEVSLSFVDDDARSICTMKPNAAPVFAEDGSPLRNADGSPFVSMIIDADAPPDLAKLDALAAARFSEAMTAAATVIERLQQAEDARRVQREAEIGAANARAEEEAAKKRKADLEAEIAKLAASVARPARIVVP